jgi:hypothetical protein
MTAAAGALPGFSDRVLRLLERVEHRIARTDREREEVFRLRYDAYVRNGLMEPRSDRRLFDERYDNAANAWITMTFVDGELAGSVRVNIGVGADANVPSLRVYPDVTAPRLSAGQIAVEYTRLAAKLSLSSAHPELAYIMMRPGYMAANHFDADLAITTPRPEHMAFYRRVFQFVPWCEPRPYPGLTATFACMGADFRESRARIEARYPFFKSTRIEREALYGPRESEIDLGFRSVNWTVRRRLGAELSTA